MKQPLFASALVAALTLLAPRADATGCSSPAECSSGFCVGGVCCDTKCDGPCEACTAAAKASGDDGVCGPASTARQCRPASCAGDVETLAANCDDKGACPAATTNPCGAYVCDGARCRTSCRSTFDCAAGKVCDDIDKVCVAANTCDGDHTIVGRNGFKKDCAPFKCDKSECLGNCVSSAQCVAPSVCDGSRCVTAEPPPAETDDGGCAMSPRSGARGGVLLAGLAGLALLGRVARRRR